MRVLNLALILGVLFIADFASAREIVISETERIVCTDVVPTYRADGTFIPGVGGRVVIPNNFRNADVTVRIDESGPYAGCTHVTVTQLLAPTQCGTMTLYQPNNTDVIRRSSCDTSPDVFTNPGRTNLTGNQTGYTGPQVNISELDAIWASWPASVKADCSAVLGCRSGNPMNVGTFHGKVREYKFDRDGMPTDGIAAGINLIRQWCQNEGLCTLMSVFNKYAPYDPRHPGNDPVAYANNVGQWLNMNPNQVYNHHDITTMAKVAMGIVRFENGKFHWGPPAIKRGAELAFQIWGAGAPPKNLGEIIPYTMTNAPPGGLGNVGNSPVDAMSSAMRAFAPFTNQTPATPVPGSIPPTQPFQNPPTTSTSTPASSGSGQSIGMILAQPKSASVGRTITVSWTTIRMDDSKPCQIFINDTQFLAQGNEGTRSTQAGPSTGPETFTMKCTDQKGSPYVQSDTVNVQ